jgi:hypothetical protein
MNIIEEQVRRAMDPEDDASMTDAIAVIRNFRGLPLPQHTSTPDVPPSEQAALPPTPASRIGYKIFRWLLALAGVLIVALICYAALTYPRTSQVNDLIGASAGQIDPVEASRRLHADWLQELKDLGQLFLLTPVFPLIAAVIGYIFGVRNGKSEPASRVHIQGSVGSVNPASNPDGTNADQQEDVD